MRISGDLVGQLITIFMAAQMRGWIDLRGLGPLLKVVVDSGNADRMREVLGEIITLLNNVEKGHTV